ncbi:MAG: colanic acid biosynthesis glycosyltransferase WcaL [Geminicoccaceae bacterium]|nr:MAG: colanic acid biosynthesis glycosyltransferase WcaL [Geminicoccaceae bacterium]
MPDLRVVVVLKGYPRLSETFIAQELHALQERGFDLVLVSLRHPTDRTTHPIHARITAPVLYLPEYLYQEPWRVLRALIRTWRRPGFGALCALWWRDLVRDRTPNRVRRFGQALVLASEVLRPGDRVYAHFIHTPGSVARYAARLQGVPLAFSAHAKDIWTTPEWEKREKLDDARFTVTCTAANRAHLAGLTAHPERVHLLYHGLDLRHLPAPPDRLPCEGSDAAAPVQLLTVARAVPKKGLDLVLEALALLPADLHWRFTHIGGGDLAPLRAKAAALGLGKRIAWRGPLPAPAVLDAYRGADLAVLASRIAADGDRDGLPNVLMEALSQGLAAVATRVAAIPELIEHGSDGWLVPPDDPAALAAALERLIRDPALRQRLGAAGARKVRTQFAMDAGIERLAALLRGEAYAEAA